MTSKNETTTTTTETSSPPSPLLLNKTNIDSNLSKENLIKFIQELVSIPSVNGKDGETKVAVRVMSESISLGMKAKLFGKHADRQNVIVSTQIGASLPEDQVKRKPLFLFIGHLDTVSIGGGPNGDLWKYPPLKGVIDNDRMYGRGVADNKSGIACALYAMAHLQKRYQNSTTLQGEILLAGVVDEESGANSDLGCHDLLKNNIIDADGAIYVEPNLNINIGHRGLIRIEIDVSGESVHTGSSKWCGNQKGQNAVTALAEILYRIEQHPWKDFDSTPSSGPLTLTVTPGTVFQGGSFESSVPDHAHSLIDIRTMPTSNSSKIIENIHSIIDHVIDSRNNRHIVASGAKLSASVNVKNNLPAACIEGGGDHPLAQACLQVLKQRDIQNIYVGLCGPANEGYMLINAGIPCICGFGPIGGNMHATNEYVEVSSLEDTVEIYQQIVEQYQKLLHNK